MIWISTIEPSRLMMLNPPGWRSRRLVHSGLRTRLCLFGLNDGTFLAISVEIRRKKGKRFSPVKAFFRQFEMMYVIADEKDVIKVRTNRSSTP